MTWEALFNGALGAGAVGVIYKLLDYYFSRNKLKAETRLISSEESEKISKAAETAVNVLLQALTFNQTENKQYQERVKTLETNQDKNTQLIKELTAHKEERDQQITFLQTQITKDVEETQKLRNDYAVSLSQIIRLEDLAIGLGEYVDKIKTAIQEKGIDLPLNGKLLESVLRLKAERAARGKK